jgi:hypothetical protein
MKMGHKGEEQKAGPDKKGSVGVLRRSMLPRSKGPVQESHNREFYLGSVNGIWTLELRTSVHTNGIRHNKIWQVNYVLFISFDPQLLLLRIISHGNSTEGRIKQIDLQSGLKFLLVGHLTTLSLSEHTAPETGWLTNVEQLVEWELAGETEVSEVKLAPKRGIIHNNSTNYLS